MARRISPPTMSDPPQLPAEQLPNSPCPLQQSTAEVHLLRKLRPGSYQPCKGSHCFNNGFSTFFKNAKASSTSCPSHPQSPPPPPPPPPPPQYPHRR
eukprot:762156-Hanusia_phi.AAC.1